MSGSGTAKSCQALGSGTTEPSLMTMPAAASYGNLRRYMSKDVSKPHDFSR